MAKAPGFESRVTFGQIVSVHGGMADHSWLLQSRMVPGISVIITHIWATDASCPRSHTATHGVYTLEISDGNVSNVRKEISRGRVHAK